MGTITSLMKAGSSSMMGQLKNYNVNGYISSALKDATSDLDLPKINVPDTVKGLKFNIDPSIVKLPAGVDTYMSPVLSGILSHVKLPAELGNIPLPTMPDLSSVSSKVDEYLSGFGLDTEKLGIRSVSDILKEPDLSALKDVNWASPVTIDTIPDLTKSMDAFDINSVQSQIDQVTSKIPDVDNIDISKYF